MEWIIGILGACLGSSGLTAIILAVLQRHWSKKDKEDDRIGALVEAMKVTMIDRVTSLGKQHIKEKEISLADKENLKNMHKAYKRLGGNGHLDGVMEEVEKLPVIPE